MIHEDIHKSYISCTYYVNVYHTCKFRFLNLAYLVRNNILQKYWFENIQKLRLEINIFKRCWFKNKHILQTKLKK